MLDIHFKMSQVVTGLLPEQDLPEQDNIDILLSCVSNIVGSTILFRAFSNDDATTRLFTVVVGIRENLYSF